MPFLFIFFLTNQTLIFMKKVLFSAALLMAAATVSFAGTPKGETKDAKAETATKTESTSTLEQEEFYVDDNGDRIDIVYPTQGPCLAPSETENCHATYTREDSSSPWVLQGSIVKGVRPF